MKIHVHENINIIAIYFMGEWCKYVLIAYIPVILLFIFFNAYIIGFKLVQISYFPRFRLHEFITLEYC